MNSKILALLSYRVDCSLYFEANQSSLAVKMATCFGKYKSVKTKNDSEKNMKHVLQIEIEKLKSF